MNYKIYPGYCKDGMMSSMGREDALLFYAIPSVTIATEYPMTPELKRKLTDALVVAAEATMNEEAK